jgi:hypothetical protein
MRIDPDKTIGWTVNFSEDGTAGATLHYHDKIDSTTEVEIVDASGTLYFIGFVAIVTRTEIGVGYEMELVDPLSGGFMSQVSFTNAPAGFPANGTREEINDWCESHDAKYHYTNTGTYKVGGSGTSAIQDSAITQRTVREGVTRGGYYNRIVVTGGAEKEIPADQETVTISQDNISITEVFQGDRMISRDVKGDEIDSRETWTWANDDSNVCTRYWKLEKAKSSFGVGSGIDYMDEVETERVVDQYDSDISEYQISETVTGREYGSVITGAQTWRAALIKAREQTTKITRYTDGNGEKEVNVSEIARNDFNATMKIPHYGENDDGSINWNDVESWEDVSVPIFGFYTMIPRSRELTTYRRKNDRPYSFTQTWGVKVRLTGADPDYWLAPSGSFYGTEDPEQPEMEEAIKILSAEVEYIEEFDQEIGTYERTEALPEEPVPGGIETDDALYDWLYQRAQNLAQSKKRQSALIDEQTLQITLTPSVEIGQSANGFETISVQHTLDSGSAQTVVTGMRPSTRNVPKRGQINVASMLIGTMRKLDRNQDNIRSGQVQKPISSNRALAVINGETYKIDNPQGGYLYAGDSVPVYRPTGRTTLGRMD